MVKSDGMKTKIILIIAALIILAAVVWGLVILLPKVHWPAAIKNSIAQPGYYKVAKVVDGDTIEVYMDGTVESVRMIGLDTPETVQPNNPVECYGKKASDFAHQTLENQTVRLEADPTNTNRDRYNRLLRYVYLPDGRLFNALMIQQGYGFAYLSFPLTKKTEFASYQDDARQAGAGLWAGECQIENQNGRYKTNDLTTYLFKTRLVLATT
jgi:endonuclease YncB( thermonuclease family)